LNALGNVIQIGTEIKGKMYTNLRNLRITTEVFIVEVLKMFNSEIMPPANGRIPVGSGEDKSVNHKKPSDNIPG
jgi:hypothetical protein